uniref:Uncharacterized protein n=1 Tax=Anguilla anguilla TaxID=7936 RepID=A0A0E9QE41_ANGAN
MAASVIFILAITPLENCLLAS